MAGFGFSMSRGTCSHTKIEKCERYKKRQRQQAAGLVREDRYLSPKKNLGRVKPWWGPGMTESKNDVIR